MILIKCIGFLLFGFLFGYFIYFFEKYNVDVFLFVFIFVDFGFDLFEFIIFIIILCM